MLRNPLRPNKITPNTDAFVETAAPLVPFDQINPAVFRSATIRDGKRVIPVKVSVQDRVCVPVAK